MSHYQPIWGTTNRSAGRSALALLDDRAGDRLARSLAPGPHHTLGSAHARGRTPAGAIRRHPRATAGAAPGAPRHTPLPDPCS
jgi:hypothetical protein